VERSGTPGIVGVRGKSREVGDSRFIEQIVGLGYRTLRALGFCRLVNLGFRFAPPPGFMLSPAPRVLETEAAITYQRFL